MNTQNQDQDQDQVYSQVQAHAIKGPLSSTHVVFIVNTMLSSFYVLPATISISGKKKYFYSRCNRITTTDLDYQPDELT